MLKVKIFYDDYFVNKLAERDASLVKKLISRFKGTIKKSAMVDSESIKYLKKLVSKFEKALDNAQSGVKISQIGNDDEEREFVNVRYSKSNEKSSIREQLKSSIDIINEMQPVAVVNSKNMTKKEVFDFAMEEFKKFGYQVERQNFGKIEIGKKEINDSLNYLNQEGEILVLLSVPKVLKRGALIDGHGNHKGRNYETVTIAAPVVINGVRGNVGVIVKQGGKNKYKTHRILMPDGSKFIFNETEKNIEPTGSDMRVKDNNQVPDIGSISNTIISQNDQKNNTFDENNSKNISDERKSVKRSYEVDSTGETLSEAQAEYFKDSKVRDKDGNLLVVYHGTMESFSVFDITKSRSYDEKLNYDLPGFYFSESNEESGGYGSAVKPYYVNVTNPYDGDTYKLAKEKGSYRKAYDYLVSQGYDGIIDTEMGEGFTEIIAFHPEQIKLITNKKPSSNPDIRYSKQRSYNPFEDVDDEGNKWVESEDENGVKILFSMPDFDNPAYEYNHIPDEEPEIVETYKAVASSSA